MINKDDLIKRMESYALTIYGKKIENCNDREKYVALSNAIMEDIVPEWIESEEKFEGKKRAYYLSAEFLMGRALSNNLTNMQDKDVVIDLLKEINVNYNDLEEAEDDAALGNGGLGRLAACFLDSAATLDYPLMGYGIRYKYGLFKQSFADGFQIETADNWQGDSDPWSIRKEYESVIVSYSDGDVRAIPYDMPIIGYGETTINTLRLWKSEAIEMFNFQEFNNQNYALSVRDKNNAENITKVLYPNDTNDEGKILRLKQQYFFASASIQDLINKHKERYNTFHNFAQMHAIQLNDTHPTVAIPEMMRILTEIEGVHWDEAWNIVQNTFSYTNHTLLAEALEQWSVRLYRNLLPHVYVIIEKINHQLIDELKGKGIEDNELGDYSIIRNDYIKMAWLSIYGCNSVNGVAAIHTNLLITSELNKWYLIYPEKFNNKTNGVTQRRWLLLSNPELAAFITELLGNDNWITNLEELKKLEVYADDANVLEKFLEIKQIKKDQLVEYIKLHEDIEIDNKSIFDIQIKRAHEYKRQLLNAFQILDLYFRLKDDPNLDIVPRTFIFGAKAAPGYFRSKGVIKYINDIANLINNDTDINGKIKVVFVTNYRVTYAEMLFPAADISEQISTAGKEASGTGNMKFMLNGAPTIGTLDGANVEIVEEAGIENNFIFGLSVENIAQIEPHYNPVEDYLNVKGLKRVVDTLIDGTFNDHGTGVYNELHDSILNGANWHRADVYYLMKDFESYREAQQKVNDAFKDRMSWARKCWMNLSNAGKFSSDRTIKQYATEIWKI